MHGVALDGNIIKLFVLHNVELILINLEYFLDISIKLL